MEDIQSINNSLEQIWNDSTLIKFKESILFERKYWYPINEGQSDILITGINPSYRKGDDNPWPIPVKNLLHRSKYDPYWSPLSRIVFEDREWESGRKGLDYRMNTSVLDLFYFREKDQKYLRDTIISSWSEQESISFLVNQLRLTQKRIESFIKPKLIIVKNKESQAYWGKLNSVDNECIWMGYQFEDIPYINRNWTLSKVVGIHPQNISGLSSSCLVENKTLVLFVPHINQYTSKTDRPTPEIIEDLLKIQSGL